MKPGCIFLHLLIAAFCLSGNVFAQPTDLKSRIEQDCNLAARLVNTMPLERRTSAVQFLFDFARLRLTNMPPDFVYQPEIGKAPGGLIGQLHFAQSLSPENQLAARQCAVSLLPLIPEESKNLLADLIRLSQDHTEDLLIRLRFEESALEIARTLNACEAPNACMSQELLEEVIETYLNTKSEVASQIIVIFSPQAASIVIDKISELDCNPLGCEELEKHLELLALLDFKNNDLISSSIKNSIAELLQASLQKDPAGQLLQSAALEEGNQAVATVRAEQTDIPAVTAPQTPLVTESKLSLLLKTFRRIPHLYEELLAFLINSVVQNPAPIFEKGVSRELVFSVFDEIFKYEAETRSLVIDPHLRLKLFDLYPALSVNERDIIQKGLIVLVRLGADYESKIKLLADSKEADLRVRAARLAEPVEPKGKTLEQILVKLINDSDLKVQVSALAVGSQFAGKLKKTVEGIAKKITSQFKSGVTDYRQLSSYTTLLLEKLPPALLSEQYKNLAYQALQAVFQDSSYDAKELLKFLSERPEIIYSALKTAPKTKEQKLFELYLIRKIDLPEFRQNMGQKILSLLSDSDRQISSEIELLVLGWETLPQAMADSKKLPAIIKYEFSSQPLEGSLIQQPACPDFNKYIDLCRAKLNPGNFCKTLYMNAARCTGSISFDLWNSKDFDRLLGINPDLLKPLLANIPADTRCPIIRSALNKGLFSTDDYGLVCDSLKNLKCQELLPDVLIKKDLALSCYQAIKLAFDQSQAGSQNQAELFRILIAIDSTGIDVKTIFSYALEHKNLTLLDMLADSNLIGELVLYIKQVMTSDGMSVPELQFVIRYIEKLAGRAESLLPELIALSQRADLAYESRRAIIAVATNNPDLRMSTLRKLIGSTGLPRLLRESEFNNLQQTANELLEKEVNSLSYLEKRDLNTLLSKLSGDSTVHFEAY